MSGHRKFSELRDALSPESRRRVAAKVESLSALRRERLLSQVEVASLIGKPQSAVSRLERQDDLLVSTLRAYVEALGGRLRIVAVFPRYEIEVDAEGAAAESGSLNPVGLAPVPEREAAPANTAVPHGKESAPDSSKAAK